MSVISKIISTTIKNGRLLVKVLAKGSADVQNIENIAPFGLDSNIPAGYKAIYASTNTKETKVLLGIFHISVLTDVGETRLFSTDKDGALKFDILLKNDGTAELGGANDFLARFNELKSGFDQLKSDHNDLVAAFNPHVHPTAAPGAPSPPNIPATPSNANIDAAKIDEIKTL